MSIHSLPSRLWIPMLVLGSLLWTTEAVEAQQHDDHDHAAHEPHQEEKTPVGHADHDGHVDEDEDAHDKEEGAVSLSPSVRREFGIETMKATAGMLQIELRVPGEVVTNPNLVAHVVPRAPGIARAVEKQIGDRVSAGDLLAVIDSPTLSQAKAAYHTQLQELELRELDLKRAEVIQQNTRKALAYLEEEPPLAGLAELEALDLGGERRELVGSYAAMVAADTTLARKRKLHQQEIASDAELQEAESTYKQARVGYLAARHGISYDNERSQIAAEREVKMAQIRLRAAERHLHAMGLNETEVAAIPQQEDELLSRLDIIAPIAGIVTQRHLVQGEMTAAEEPAFVISDYSSVWVYLTLYQKDISSVRAGMPATVILTGTGTTATGKIDLVSPEVDEATRTATARLVLPNPNGVWRPGAFVTGQIIVRSQQAEVLVPRTALVQLEGRPAVFVETAGGFEPRHVTTGMGDNEQVEILTGLQPGETFVSRNPLPLKAELNRAALEHAGHAH